MSALILVEIPDPEAGQTLFQPVLDPGPLYISEDAAIAGHPPSAVPATNHRADSVKPLLYYRPTVTVEFPNLILRGAPNCSVAQVDKPRRIFRRTFVC